MRVLLVSTNRSRDLVPPFPLGLACVVASLDDTPHTVRVWDAMFEDDWQASLRAALREARPDVIGLSVRNVDDQDMRAPRFFVDEVREMAAVCREESAATLVGGGAGFGMFPEAITRYVGLDGGVAGEGERVFPQVLERLEAGQSPAGLPGVVWCEGGRLVSTPPDWSRPLDGLPRAKHSAFDGARYHDTRGTAGFPNSITVQSKRGCPLPCSYCATCAIEGATIRVRSPQSVADEMLALQEQGFERVQFVDSVFTNPAWHARALCDEFVRRGVRIRWSATVSPAHADPELLRQMKDAGCVLAMVGNESGHADTLRSLGKPFGPDDVARCFQTCQEVGLGYNAYLLLGAPGETPDTVRASVDLARRFQPTNVSVSVGVRLYPGCGLTRLARDEGLLAPGDDLLQPRFYLAPAVRDWIWGYLDPVMAAEPRWSL